MNSDDYETTSSCRCLNVKVRRQSPKNAVAPNLFPSVDSEFRSVYVDDSGINVAHPQVTLRTRSKGLPVAETSRSTRYVTLTCLICQTVVYRVHQTVPVELEGKEGPILPSDEWAEQETLKSADGWIDLHKGCLTGDAIRIAEKSPSYSSIFSVIIPSISTPPPEVDPDTSYIPSLPGSPTNTPNNLLSDMRPLFPPPPFTPSNPVFIHLSSLATIKSQALRAEAEMHLAEIVKVKLAEIEEAEGQLRKDVEAIWRGFREGLGKVGHKRSLSGSRSTKRKSSGNWQEDVTPGGSRPSPARVVREFNPVPSPRRVASPTQTQRMSSLSASLANSSFHHPRALVEQNKGAVPQQESRPSESPHEPPPYSSQPSSPASSKGYSSLSTPSSRSMSILANGVETPLKPFRRNMDQANDTATSFRYFTILEADSLRARHQDAEAQDDTAQGTSGNDGGKAEPSEASANGSNSKKSNGSESHSRKASSRTEGGREPAEIQEADNGSKGKRKVTFDVKPEVVHIKREVNSEKKAEEKELTGRASEEMIFDYEDEGGERAATGEALAFNEPAHLPSRPTRTRPTVPGLPASLSSLRPSSLPAPSTAPRPQRMASNPGIEAIEPIKGIDDLSKGPAKQISSENDEVTSDDPEPLDIHEAEIRKLVAADTPSHRGAWKKGSKAWKTFIRRQDGKGRDSGLIPEENEDGNKHVDSDSDEQERWGGYKPTDIVNSVPISIGPLTTKSKEALSLASYQPKTSLSDAPGTLVPPLPQSRQKTPISSAAWRKAAYAERDRNRAQDPGALDFAAEGDDDDDDNEDEDNSAAEQGGRGRQRALKILQVRSEIPDSGMWRSLAS